jgi:two-component system, LytTR family, sensor kinase
MRNIKTISIHILFWLLYVASEYFANLMHMQSGGQLRFFQATFLSLPALLLSTYFIALYVVPKYLKTNQWHWFILWILAVAVFVFFARIKGTELLEYLRNGEYFKMPAAKLLKNIIRDYSIIALAVCVYIIGDYRKNQRLNEQLAKAKAEAEIKLLKGQLHPHFLFNSLNNIYSLALMKSDLTADSILKLTELLDYLVYRANMDKVALSKEVQLLENYMGLEKLRYGDKLKVEMGISLRNEGVQVAPLILLPFAENCFKHGGTGADGVFSIRIQLHYDDQKLVFNIANSKRKRKEKSPVNGGVGLENIRQRLTLLYPNRHKLEISDGAEEYGVKLVIERL